MEHLRKKDFVPTVQITLQMNFTFYNVARAAAFQQIEDRCPKFNTLDETGQFS